MTPNPLVQITGECSIEAEHDQLAAHDLQVLVERLEALSPGQGIRLSFADQAAKRSLMARLYLQLRRRGIAITVRNKSDIACTVYRSERKPRWHNSSLRAIEMQEAYLNGETLQEIAARYRICRERVRQIIRFSTLPPQERSSEFLKFMEPYVAAVSETRRCILCKSEIADGQQRRHALCSNCRRFLDDMTDAASKIRHFKKTGEHMALANALKFIRKWGAKPEVLEGM